MTTTNGSSQIKFGNLAIDDAFRYENRTYQKTDADHGQPGSVTEEGFEAVRSPPKMFTPDTWVVKITS